MIPSETQRLGHTLALCLAKEENWAFIAYNRLMYMHLLIVWNGWEKEEMKNTALLGKEAIGYCLSNQVGKVWNHLSFFTNARPLSSYVMPILNWFLPKCRYTWTSLENRLQERASFNVTLDRRLDTWLRAVVGPTLNSLRVDTGLSCAAGCFSIGIYSRKRCFSIGI